MMGESLIKSYAFSADVILAQVGEISHEESLKQPFSGGHSINWLLGHILSARSFPLKFVGAEAVWTEEERARYRHGSLPIRADGPGVQALETLIERFALSQQRLVAGLAKMSATNLNAASGFKSNTIFDSLLYFHFHETYHTGQMTIIAELLGKSAKYLAL